MRIGLEFLKDFKTAKCGRQPPSLKYQEKNAALRSYKEQRKVEKKQRAKQQKEDEKKIDMVREMFPKVPSSIILAKLQALGGVEAAIGETTAD